jgi:signal transduction histidine kinase
MLAIFDKFYQSRNQNIKKPVGSGLGLAICKQIIEHHKGSIGVKIMFDRLIIITIIIQQKIAMKRRKF